MTLDNLPDSPFLNKQQLIVTMEQMKTAAASMRPSVSGEEREKFQAM